MSSSEIMSRLLALLTDTVAQGVDLASGMKKNRVWSNRQALVRNCIGRHKHGDFHRMLKEASQADQAATGLGLMGDAAISVRIRSASFAAASTSVPGSSTTNSSPP